MAAISVVCVVCGAIGATGAAANPDDAGSSAARPPVGWMSEVDPQRGTVWVCPACVRRHVRSIEARLDHEWW